MNNIIPNLEALDQKTPGQVYLCQVNYHVACGACCGLYNIKDLSEENLVTLLNRRTDVFGKTQRSEEDIDGFADFISRTESRYRPLKSFHHCPFIGFPDRNKPVVGCLLHPLADGNDGVDYRGLSYYGGYACRSYFCPTVYQLPYNHKKILRVAAPNWYLYGLVITEFEMLKRFFEIIESRLGKPTDSDTAIHTPNALEPITQIFFLKTTWPYRKKGAPIPINDVINHQTYEFLWESIDYHKLKLKPSIWTPVFHALNSIFTSAQEVMKAEEQLDRLVHQFLYHLK